MLDFAMIAVIVGFFLICFGYLAGCGRLRPRRGRSM